MNKPVERLERLDIQAILADSAAAARKSRWRRPLAMAVMVSAVLVLAYWWLFSGGAGAVRYETAPVTQGRLVVGVTATGAIQPTNRVDISSELSGTVREVFVDYNSTVKAGQKLAELDTDKLVATLGSARAKLRAAEARVADAEATLRERVLVLERTRKLAGMKVSSAQTLEAAEAGHARAAAAVESARADVGVAQADVKLNETNLAKAHIHSPIDGVVLVRNIDPGQTVASSFQAPVLFSIAEDLRQMELQVDVDEADVGEVRQGQKATFSVDAFPGKAFPATIREVRFSPETIQGVVTYKGILDIDNSQLLLRPGMTATAEIDVIEIEQAMLVPNAALRYVPPEESPVPKQSFIRRMLPGPPQFRPASQPDATGTDRRVFVLREGRPVAVEVAIGPSDGEVTQIVSGGLATGDPVITDQSAGGQ